MRWDELFRDLEAQAEAAERAEVDAEVTDRSRRELAAVRLTDRLRAAGGSTLTLSVTGGLRITGLLADTGPDWLLLEEAGGGSALVPLAAVLGLAGLPPWASAPDSEGAVAARLRLGYALRGLARDRAAVTVFLTDGAAVAGTIDRVGADFLEVTEHPVGEPRRRGAVRGARVLPFAGVALVRSR